MPAAFIVVRPSYSGGTRSELPRLAAGVAGWVQRLRDHDITVDELPTLDRPGSSTDPELAVSLLGLELDTGCP